MGDNSLPVTEWTIDRRTPNEAADETAKTGTVLTICEICRTLAEAARGEGMTIPHRKTRKLP